MNTYYLNGSYKYIILNDIFGQKVYYKIIDNSKRNYILSKFRKHHIQNFKSGFKTDILLKDIINMLESKDMEIFKIMIDIILNSKI